VVLQRGVPGETLTADTIIVSLIRFYPSPENPPPPGGPEGVALGPTSELLIERQWTMGGLRQHIAQRNGISDVGRVRIAKAFTFALRDPESIHSKLPWEHSDPPKEGQEDSRSVSMHPFNFEHGTKLVWRDLSDGLAEGEVERRSKVKKSVQMGAATEINNANRENGGGGGGSALKTNTKKNQNRRIETGVVIRTEWDAPETPEAPAVKDEDKCDVKDAQADADVQEGGVMHGPLLPGEGEAAADVGPNPMGDANAGLCGSLRRQKWSKDMGEMGGCSICLTDPEDIEEGEEMIVLNCFHVLHPDCAASWINENAKCPVCYEPI